MVPHNANAPHRAVIFIQAEVHELRPNGECTGMPVYTIKQFPVYLDGLDKNIAVRKLNELLEGLKAQCRPS